MGGCLEPPGTWYRLVDPVAPKGLCLDTNLQSVVLLIGIRCCIRRKVLFWLLRFLYISKLDYLSNILAFFHWRTHFCTFPCPFLWQKKARENYGKKKTKTLIHGYNMPLRKTHSISKRAQGKLKKNVRAKRMSLASASSDAFIKLVHQRF